MLDIVILTGMSGAGKSMAADFFEDTGYFCIDNLPPPTLSNLVSTFLRGQGGEGFGIHKLAFVIDIRSNELLRGMGKALQDIEDMGCLYKMIFLEADTQVLINRFRQTRRRHPLDENIGLTEAIRKERDALASLRAAATHVIDTSLLAASALREELHKIIYKDQGQQKVSVLVESFGFKYGIPVDCDNIYDVRFLPNPFYDAGLKHLSGKDEGIGLYLREFPETDEFIMSVKALSLLTLPFYLREGKSRLVIGIGCTGGRHRSVYIAECLSQLIRGEGYETVVYHRDIDKDPRYAAPPVQTEVT